MPPVLIHDLSQVGYWPFDHDDGDYARDRSGHVNHGTLYGPTRVAGKVADALSFDGENDYVEVPYDASLDAFDAFTIAFWVYPTLWADGQSRAMIDKGWVNVGGFIIFFDHTVVGRMYYNTKDSVGTRACFATLPSLFQWYHVIAVFQRGTKNKLYFNGTLKAESSVTADEALTLEQPVRIAQSANDFKGILDEVRIYNRALSAAEIRRLMNMRGI